MKTGTLLRTEGQGLAAQVEYDGRVYTVMDPAPNSRPGPIRFEFLAGLCGLKDDWDSVFTGNPGRRIGVEPVSGWTYRAYGKIVGVNPVVVDCGVLRVTDVVATHDERCIGEYVGFTIDRLEFEAKRLEQGA